MEFQTVFWDDYELLDAGGGKKLERFGSLHLIRPEVQAYFKSGMPFSDWYDLADAEFVETGAQKGVWKKLNPTCPDTWQIDALDLRFQLQFTQFKHIGLFPEQYINWEFIRKQLPAGGAFLNLFAYTGAASVVANSTENSSVLHVDAVKQLIQWASDNQALNGQNGIKWVLEDALKFAQREVKRGHRYHGIIMDPPAFGLGANKEKWILDEKLPALFAAASELLLPNGFLVVNTYSPKINVAFLRQQVSAYFPGSKVELGELWSTTKTGKRMYHGNLVRLIK